jgi:hypothetical protein
VDYWDEANAKEIPDINPETNEPYPDPIEVLKERKATARRALAELVEFSDYFNMDTTERIVHLHLLLGGNVVLR